MQNSGSARFLTGCGFFMMLVLLVLGGGLVYSGIREFGEAREFPKPEPVPCAELVRRKPDHGWFRIPDGVLDVEDAVWEESIGSGKLRRAFVPLFVAGSARTGKAAILVETKDEAILEQVQELIDEKKTGLSRYPMDTLQKRSQYWITRPVEGRIPGFNRPGVIARRMQDGGISWRVAADYVYIAEGEAPSSGAAWGFTGFGALLVALIGTAIVKMIQEQSAKRT